MPPRFAALSPWRNLVAKPAQATYSEIPIAATQDANIGGNAIDASDRRIYVRGSGPGTIIALDVGEQYTGKLGASNVATHSLPSAGGVSDIRVSPWGDGVVAVGTDDGSIVLLKDGEHLEVGPVLKHVGAAGTLVRWHPQAADIIATASPSSSTICVWNVASNSAEAALSLAVEGGPKSAGKFVQDLTWNTEGTHIIAAFADGTIRSYEARSQSAMPTLSSSPPSFGLPKPIRVAAVGRFVLMSTLSSSRQRELRVFAADNFKNALQTITLDTASSPLALAVDVDRNLVFMGSRGDVTMRWIELDDNQKFPQGAFPMPARTSFAAHCLLQPKGLDVMKAEINRLYVASASSSEVIPIQVEITQRQLIDYHPHLFPDTSSGRAALSAEDWLSGSNGEVSKVSMDPSRRSDWGRGAASDVRTKAAPPQTATPAATSKPNDSVAVGSKLDQTSSSLQPKTAGEPVKALEPAQADPLADKHASARKVPDGDAAVEQKHNGTSGRVSRPEPVAAEPVKAPTVGDTRVPQKGPATSAPTTPATWSRTTLSGTTPLLSAFTSVPAFDASVAPAATSFVATPTHLLYPLAGPGGRLAFFEIARAGRLPEAKDASWIETGVKVADFAVDPFDSCRVVTVSEDGITTWTLPKAHENLPHFNEDKSGNSSGKTLPDYEQRVISESNEKVALSGRVGRASRACFHPAVKDVVLVAGSDGLAVLDLSASPPAVVQALPDVPTAGEVEWSSEGSLAAFARSSDRKLVVWNTRKGDQTDTAAHDSPRPFKIVWIDERRLVTVGHAAGSMRQVKLFEVASDLSLKEVGRLNLDTSPALLFPHYDADACLLYLWSKGERSISALHVSLNAPKPKFGSPPPLFKPLPAFQHGQPQLGVSLLPKRYCDVREVEVDLCYRLSRNNEIQRISWRVERKRKEFFQDDVFSPTLDTETPALSAQEWLDGQEVPTSERRRIDLRPAGMEPLSTAPPPEPTIKSDLPKHATQRERTDKEKADELMNNVFAKAKKADEQEEIEETAARRRAPADDDWGDDD